MSLLTIVICLALAAFLFYAVQRWVPAGVLKQIILAVIIIVVVVWLLKVFGIWSHIERIRI